MIEQYLEKFELPHDLNKDHEGVVIVLFDERPSGQIKEIGPKSGLLPTASKICDVLFGTNSQNGMAPNAKIIGASYLDCLEEGYDAVRKKIETEFGNIQIEIHAYSLTDGPPLEKAKTSFHDFSNLNSDPFVICQPGNEDFRQNFPATETESFSVGLIAPNGKIVGGGLNGMMPLSLLVEGPADENSSALAIVSGIAAMLCGKLGESQEVTKTMIQVALLSFSRKEGEHLILNPFPLGNKSVEVTGWTGKRACSSKIVLKVRKKETENVSISLLGTSIPSLQGWIPRPVSFSLNVEKEEVQAEGGQLVCGLDSLKSGHISTIHIQANGQFEQLSLCANGIELLSIEESFQPIKKEGDQVIVGVSASHDASACLLINGKVVNAIQLERLTRIKHDGGPYLKSDLAIQYCLDSAGLTTEDVDVFAFNSRPLMPEYTGLSQPVAAQSFKSFDPFSKNTIFVSHHLCHAFAAYGGSQFKRAKIIVADGAGGTTVGRDDLIIDGLELQEYLKQDLGSEKRVHVLSVYDFDSNGFQMKKREYSRAFNFFCGSESLGETYAAVSNFVFGSWQASGKLMGMAPYGKAESVENFCKMGENGLLDFDHLWKLNYSVDGTGQTNPMEYKNLAASVQHCLEEALVNRFNTYLSQDDEHIVFTGGIGLNSVANTRLRGEFPDKEFYFFPAQHDAGVAIGAAFAAHFKLGKKIESSGYQNDYLGHRYEQRDVNRAINRYVDRLKVSPISHEAIAQYLAQGKIYGFYSLEMGAEFGPRSLGARTILADPSSRETWDFINTWIKFREEFRPFAPVVTREDVGRFFEEDGSFPYMLDVVKVREAYRSQLEAITHVDNTARVQTLSKAEHGRLYRILKAFEKEKGFPILLNTSFNVRGQPIVETPSQAIEMLLCTNLDGLIFDDRLIEMEDDQSPVAAEDHLVLSPRTHVEVQGDHTGIHAVLNVRSQAKKIVLSEAMQSVMLALPNNPLLAQGMQGLDGATQSKLLEELESFRKAKYINRIVKK